ncbi:acetylglutamate kinase [Alteromonadaceae bacterium BrNp21-10]|nr:acetylglutamate kinase [Alteromonadaceae bacterium BrNp21-10]
MKTPLVIKVGGALLDSPMHLQRLFDVICKLQQKRPVLLVHGGGALVQQWLDKLGLESVKLDGLRVTPKEHIPYVTGALAGAANTQLVLMAKQAGIKAVGLSLVDADVANCQVLDEKYGNVGTATPGQAYVLSALMANHFFPIISSIGASDDGELLNVNADQAAVAIAQSVAGELLLLSDVPGVLDAEKQLISALNKDSIATLIADGVITDGMMVKVNAALETANKLDNAVIIAGWKTPEKLSMLLAGESVGTTIYPDTAIHLTSSSV